MSAIIRTRGVSPTRHYVREDLVEIMLNLANSAIRGDDRLVTQMQLIFLAHTEDGPDLFNRLRPQLLKERVLDAYREAFRCVKPEEHRIAELCGIREPFPEMEMPF